MLERHSNKTPCLEMKTHTVQKSSASGTFHVLFFFLFCPLSVSLGGDHSTNLFPPLSAQI